MPGVARGPPGCAGRWPGGTRAGRRGAGTSDRGRSIAEIVRRSRRAGASSAIADRRRRARGGVRVAAVRTPRRAGGRLFRRRAVPVPRAPRPRIGREGAGTRVAGDRGGAGETRGVEITLARREKRERGRRCGRGRAPALRAARRAPLEPRSGSSRTKRSRSARRRSVGALEGAGMRRARGARALKRARENPLLRNTRVCRWAGSSPVFDSHLTRPNNERATTAASHRHSLPRHVLGLRRRAPRAARARRSLGRARALSARVPRRVPRRARGGGARRDPREEAPRVDRRRSRRGRLGHDAAALGERRAPLRRERGRSQRLRPLRQGHARVPPGGARPARPRAGVRLRAPHLLRARTIGRGRRRSHLVGPRALLLGPRHPRRRLRRVPRADAPGPRRGPGVRRRGRRRASRVSRVALVRSRRLRRSPPRPTRGDEPSTPRRVARRLGRSRPRPRPARRRPRRADNLRRRLPPRPRVAFFEGKGLARRKRKGFKLLAGDDSVRGVAPRGRAAVDHPRVRALPRRRRRFRRLVQGRAGGASDVPGAVLPRRPVVPRDVRGTGGAGRFAGRRRGGVRRRVRGDGRGRGVRRPNRRRRPR